jgi:transposase-like protein
MSQKGYRPEEIIGKLREAEVLLSQGVGIEEVCRKIEVTKMTFYRWRREYGKLRVDQARRLKELERENARLKKLVADLSLDAQILKEAASGNS